jgi:hypothetical protein
VNLGIDGVPFGGVDGTDRAAVVASVLVGTGFGRLPIERFDRATLLSFALSWTVWSRPARVCAGSWAVETVVRSPIPVRSRGFAPAASALFPSRRRPARVGARVNITAVTTLVAGARVATHVGREPIGHRHVDHYALADNHLRSTTTVDLSAERRSSRACRRVPVLLTLVARSLSSVGEDFGCG